MAKVMKNFRIEQSILDGVSVIADAEYGGNMTAAIENMLKHSIEFRKVSESDRDRLRVQAKRNDHFGIYEKHESIMHDFFWI